MFIIYFSFILFVFIICLQLRYNIMYFNYFIFHLYHLIINFKLFNYKYVCCNNDIYYKL